MKRTPEQLKRHREYMRRYLKEHPEYSKRQNKLRYMRDAADKAAARNRINTWHKRRKQEVFLMLGNKCVCCGESTYEFLTFDHKHGGGMKHRGEAGVGGTFWKKVLADPEAKNKYRILCFNCHMSITFFKYCPHERERFNVIGIAC
jgi:hypothetical protein